jgi:prenylcysteine oxidase/farnesylcysteine lyase
MVLDGLRQRAANSGRTRLAIIVVVFVSLTLLLSQPFHFRPSGYFPPTVEAEELQYPVSSHDGAINQLRPKRIAIVGAGASGSATAFFLRRAARVMAERIGVPEEKLVGDIVVFDKEGYIGGSEWHSNERRAPR